mmetsp:Transcript_7809/g.9046  ORF Transcript_7809/g.9046 Transcript_7809/m.9046 type:complete len:474 (-) Transcript_7809:614-2035(-)|eukprot:CAMPEP_0197843318 /NCGR_PEP_ID=MMETSP1438-20131217/170_1 /TAXON_ID=1461541 /ORGANISM="Pterosperma sp., Strain CCMP1384" /LENGTH=473 /DNA_ID=CAMNT_0043453387 /DNA_START=108 /DNA_END=1529 /DNA_ORIENTATION=+
MGKGGNEGKEDILLPNVWKNKSMDTVAKSSKLRSETEYMRDLLWKYNQAHREMQFNLQMQVKDSLKRTYGSLDSNINKLDTTHKNAVPVIARLESTKDMLESEKQGKEAELETCRARLDIRSKRPAPELVNDEPHLTLKAEESLLTEAISQLSKGLKDVGDAIDALNKSQEIINADLQDKQKAMELNRKSDEQCPEPALKLPDITKPADSPNLGNVPPSKEEATGSANTLKNVQEWQQSTQANVDKSNRLQKSSIQLCEGCDSMARWLNESAEKAHERVAKASIDRLFELKKMHKVLKEHHNLTLEEISQAEHTHAMVTKALTDLDDPLKITKARQSIHDERPGQELTEDDVQITISKEYGVLQEQHNFLAGKAKSLEAQLQDLYNTRDELAKDIENKEICIDLDAHSYSYPDKTYDPGDPQPFWNAARDNKTALIEKMKQTTELWDYRVFTPLSTTNSLRRGRSGGYSSGRF